MEETREGRFIANDLYLNAADEGPSLLLITGPNMAAKAPISARRQCLFCLPRWAPLCPPTACASVSWIASTRASAQRQCCARPLYVHVEMTETATILNTATNRSLILLDEMGRGTATFDGLSLAWATVEYLHAETGARTLFATHYHELTMLAEKLSRVRNLRVGVKEAASGIVFLHNIEPGAAARATVLKWRGSRDCRPL